MKILNFLEKLINLKINKIFFFFIILILLTGCNKKEAYFFNYKDYYSLFENEKKIHNSIKKYFYRNFYDVKILNINSLSEFPQKLDQLGRSNTNGILYLEGHLSPFLLKNTNFKNSKLKLLTYDIPPVQLDSSSVSAFNIQLDPKIIETNLINILNTLSKNNLKECAIILNTDYNICIELNKLLHKYNNLNIILVTELDYKSKVQNLLSSNERKIILFYGYNANKYLKELNKDEYAGFTIIEAQTNYGEVYNVVNYRIDINWHEIILLALHTKEFLAFQKNINQNLEVVNYTSKYKNPLIFKKYTKFKTADEIIIEIDNRSKKMRKNYNKRKTSE